MQEVLVPCDEAVYPGRNVAYTGTAGSTSTWPPGPAAVAVTPTTDCYVIVGEGVTATTSSMFVPANATFKIRVPAGTSAPWRVSAIQKSAAGTIEATPLQG